MSVYSVRGAQPSDAAQLLNVFQRLSKEEPMMGSDPKDHELDDFQVGQAISQIASNACLFVALENATGTVVGFAQAFGDINRSSSGRAEVQIGVIREHQRHRIGQTLLEQIIKWADNLGIWRLELRVLTTNFPAIALYEKMGFVKEGILRCDIRMNGKLNHQFMMSRLHPQALIVMNKIP